MVPLATMNPTNLRLHLRREAKHVLKAKCGWDLPWELDTGSDILKKHHYI